MLFGEVEVRGDVGTGAGGLEGVLGKNADSAATGKSDDS